MLFFALDNCPLCSLSGARLWIENEHAVAFAATEPIADGHIVVAPRKHVDTICELAPGEQKALWALVSEVKSRLLTGLSPCTFSIGFNDTLDQGTGTDHAAIHVVPRRRGEDVELPAGLEWVTDDSLHAAKK